MVFAKRSSIKNSAHLLTLYRYMIVWCVIVISGLIVGGLYAEEQRADYEQKDDRAAYFDSQ